MPRLSLDGSDLVWTEPKFQKQNDRIIARNQQSSLVHHRSQPVRIFSSNQIQAQSSETFPSVPHGERGSDADDTGRLLELRSNHHHQIHQPFKRVDHPESLKLRPFRNSNSATVRTIVHDSSLEQGSDHISIGPVGIVAAKSLCEPVRTRSKLEVDAVAQGEWVLPVVILENALVLCQRPDPRVAWDVKGGVPKLHFEVVEEREERDAVDTGGEGAEMIEELVPDFFGLVVRLGVDADAEAPLHVNEHGEDLVAELPVGPRECGQLGRTVLGNWTLNMEYDSGYVIDDHGEDVVANLRR